MWVIRLQFVALALAAGGMTGLHAQNHVSVTDGTKSYDNSAFVQYPPGQIIVADAAPSPKTTPPPAPEVFEVTTEMVTIEGEGIGLFRKTDGEPQPGVLTLMTTRIGNVVYFFQLSNQAGKIMDTHRMDGREAAVDLSKNVPGTYFLKVIAIWHYGHLIENKRDVRTFRIIKKWNTEQETGTTTN